ncbi:unnamed protein product, partial [Leptidea sinapis]
SASKYPSSIGLSGAGSSWPFSNSGSKYPASTGLSGSSSGSKYPASTGLSGSGSGSKYPASTGLSGSSSGSKYPASIGLSGSGSGRSKYPASTGLSGSNSGSKYPISTGTSGSSHGSKYYPPSSTGLAGSGTGNGASSYRHSSHTSHSNKHYSNNMGASHNPTGPTYVNNYYGSNYHVPSYYTMPQHVYITEYRSSGSRYGDLLTGLTLYNLGRSHSHYHEHYYYDDYYRRRYDTPGYVQSHQNSYKPKDEAHCLLRIKEYNNEETLKIPCEIVSTFTDGSKQLPKESIKVDKIICYNTTTTNKTSDSSSSSSTVSPTVITGPTTTAIPIVTVSTKALNQSETLSVLPLNLNVSDNNTYTQSNATTTELTNIAINTTSTPLIQNVTKGNFESTPTGNISTSTEISSTTDANINTKMTDSTSTKNDTSSAIISVFTISTPLNISYTSTTAMPTTTSEPKSNTSNVTTITTVLNSTCVTESVLKDPLALTGPPPNPNAMKCEVEILTRDHRLKTKVDCGTLMEYSKMPEPKREPTSNIPSREKLKSWLSSPPWWMSLFIAV